MTYGTDRGRLARRLWPWVDAASTSNVTLVA